MTIELRVLTAGIALLIYSKLIKRDLKIKELWKKYLIIGALNAAIPFTLISTATIYLDASVAAILNSTTPLFTAALAWIWLKEEMNIRKIAGMIIGLSGVVVLVGWDLTALSSRGIYPALLSILAAAFYGMSGIYAKRAFKGVDSLSLATGQQLGAAILLIPFALTNIPSGPIPNMVIIAVLSVALLGTAIAYLLYFYLIANVGPTKTLSVTFLVPIFGMIWGAVFLQETITLNMIMGLLVILTGVSLILNIRVNLGVKWRRSISTNKYK